MSPLTRRMAGEFRFGLMDLDTMGSGRTEWPMAMADWFTRRETSTKELGLMIKQMVMGNFLGIMAQNMWAVFYKGKNMGMEDFFSLMEKFMKVSFSMEK